MELRQEMTATMWKRWFEILGGTEMEKSEMLEGNERKILDSYRSDYSPN